MFTGRSIVVIQRCNLEVTSTEEHCVAYNIDENRAFTRDCSDLFAYLCQILDSGDAAGTVGS